MREQADLQGSDLGRGRKPGPLVLASSSVVRRKILTSVGLMFEAVAPDVAEDDLKSSMAGAPAEVTATALASAKADTVASRPEFSEHFIIGCDQILVLDDALLDKPANLAEARERLRRLRGRKHQLVGAIVLVRSKKLIWSHVETMTLFMRDFSDDFLERYLATEGETICQSVGAYRLEGLGAQLFSRIEGDYFSILGLPLLPLLNALRAEGVVPT